ncbi:hypothetical protein PP707_02695 [Acetobacter pasteurianus]|nr:hypothetical protein [Acetobacter pasteurianus]
MSVIFPEIPKRGFLSEIEKSLAISIFGTITYRETLPAAAATAAAAAAA